MSQTIPIVAIIGRANVGKSSLFNRLVGNRQAIIDDAPGTTRDANYGLITWGKHNFWLVDTAGFKKAENELESSIREQIDQVALAADVIIVTIDAGVMITTEDRDAARLALKTGKPVMLAMSKVDTTNTTGLADNFERLGIKPMIGVSAIHGRGTGDLLDAVASHLKPAQSEATDPNLIKLALLGRPNVGKSSLLNSLAGKQQAIVSDLPGTTRDINTIDVVYHGTKLQITDTAGLRRRGKVEPGVEKFSSLRTLSAIAASDICLLLIDATEPSVAQDQHIAGLVEESGKGLILIINKWDAVEDKDERTQARILRRLQTDFAFVPWAPVVFTSATTGLHVTNVFKLALEIRDRRRTKIATGPLNKIMEGLILKHPPAGLKNRQPKLNYATQTGTEPPVFTLFGSHVEFLHFGYRRYLENGLRDKFDFTGTPIRLEYRDKRKPKA